jgi:hypothetical protein
MIGSKIEKSNLGFNPMHTVNWAEARVKKTMGSFEPSPEGLG